MAKTTAKYETIFIVNAELGEEGAASVAEKFKALVAENGTVIDTDDWGKRRFSYPINDLLEGYYYLIRFESTASFPAELDRVYNITDGVLRSLIIAADAA